MLQLSSMITFMFMSIFTFSITGQYGTSDQFDTTLMICLLRNLKPYTVEYPNHKGWDEFQPTDTSCLADLARVKYYRNFVSHHVKGELSEPDYSKYWSDLEQVG